MDEIYKLPYNEYIKKRREQIPDKYLKLLAPTTDDWNLIMLLWQIDYYRTLYLDMVDRHICPECKKLVEPLLLSCADHGGKNVPNI